MSLYNTFQREVSRQGNFKLSGQGQVFNFVRQGNPGKLSVMAMGKEIFSILIWAIIIVGGIYMLKLKCNDRIMIILAIVLFAGLLHLFQPVLIRQILKTGIFAIVLVILLWITQWGRTMLPQLQQQAAIRRQKKLEKNQSKKAQTETEQKSSPDENKQ